MESKPCNCWFEGHCRWLSLGLWAEGKSRRVTNRILTPQDLKNHGEGVRTSKRTLCIGIGCLHFQR